MRKGFSGLWPPRWDGLCQGPQCHVARNDDDGHAALSNGNAHGAQQDLRQLVGVAHHLGVMAALLEQMLGMRCLEVIDADLAARYVRRNREHGHVVAMNVEQAVDEVKVAGTAAAGADRELSREVGLGAGREGGVLFMAKVNPLDGFHTAQRIGEAVQRISYDAVDALDARLGEGLRHVLCCVLLILELL